MNAKLLVIGAFLYAGQYAGHSRDTEVRQPPPPIVAEQEVATLPRTETPSKEVEKK